MTADQLPGRVPRRLPRRLLGVWAHPDDETYLSAALMRRVVASGGHVCVVSATRGELGGEPGLTGPQLGARRERELVRAMAQLGVTDVRVLGHPDGGCGAADPLAAADALADVVGDVDPDLVVTFGPDGITRHADHVAVGCWTTMALRRAGSTSRLLYAVMTRDFVARHRREYADLPLTVSGPPLAVGWGDVALCIEPTDDERRRKRAALSAHETQVGPLAAVVGAERLHAWWTVETFRAPIPVDPARHRPVSTSSPDPLQASRGRAAHSAEENDDRRSTIAPNENGDER